MFEKKTYQITKISSESIVIFSTSYISPTSSLPIIEEELKKMNYSGQVLFDLLLTNGYNFNRFIKAQVVEGKFDRRSFKIVESSVLDKTTLNEANSFYKSNPCLVENNLILLEEDKHHLMSV